MRSKKTAAIIAAATAALLMLTGCQSMNTSSVPTISVNPVNTGNSSANSQTSAKSSKTESNKTENSKTESSKAESGAASEPISSETESSSEQSASEPDTSTPGVKGELSGTIIVDATGRGMPIFGGGTGETYASALNEVAQKVGAGSEVNVFSMIVPTQGSFYMPEGMSMASEWDCIQNVNDQLNGIIPVDAYTALSKHTDEEIYARTDHHWMQLGAYYAAEEFVKTAQISEPFTPLSEYERRDIAGYLGTLYGYSNENATMAANPETFTYYIAPNDFSTYYMNPEDYDFTQGTMFVDQPTSSSYSTFMGGDEKVVHVQTDVTNGRKLLVVKDSYPNALIPCLTGSFEEIWSVDMRYLEEMKNFPTSISQIVRDKGVTDVLFCMDTFSAVGENANHLPGIV